MKKTGFARIRMKPTDRYDMEVVLPQGVCLKLSHGVPVDYVKRLLQVLR